MVERHVPAASFRWLLEDRPAAIDLAVLGLPYGSPGTGPENQREAYDMIMIGRDGATALFASYPAA